MGVRITVQSLWPDAGASGFVYEFAQSKIIIGRAPSADVQLPNAAVSGTHATIRAHGAGYVLVDEGSTNGTRVNDILVAPGRPKALRAHDFVDLGGYRLVLDLGVPVAEPTSARLSHERAKRMLAGKEDTRNAAALEAELRLAQAAQDESVDLLPIVEDEGSDPPRARGSRPSRPRASHPDSKHPDEAPAKLARSEVAVYALAVIVLATSIVAMVLLMQR